MARYEIKFERVVRTYETFHRVIEAESPEAALEKAERMASDANSNCPDDAAEVQGAAEFESWEAEVGDETDEPADEEE